MTPIDAALIGLAAAIACHLSYLIGYHYGRKDERRKGDKP